MAWGNCPTHGPIQDAEEVRVGKPHKVHLYCKCGLECSEYDAEGYIDPSEVYNKGQEKLAQALAKEQKAAQKKVDADTAKVQKAAAREEVKAEKAKAKIAAAEAAAQEEE